MAGVDDNRAAGSASAAVADDVQDQVLAFGVGGQPVAFVERDTAELGRVSEGDLTGDRRDHVQHRAGDQCLKRLAGTRTTTLPGQTVDITVPTRAHNHPGTAEVHWKMVDEAGYEFFPEDNPDGIFATVIVRD